MVTGFVAYAGRAWPVEQEPDAHRKVGSFATLSEALCAFACVDFRPLPALGGRLRWRGWSPHAGLIVQIERQVSTDRADGESRRPVALHVA